MAWVAGISLSSQFGFLVCVLIRGKVKVARDPVNLKVKNIFSSTCPIITCFNSCEAVDFVYDTILFSMQFFGAIMNKVEDMLARVRELIIEGPNYGLAVRTDGG